MKKRKLKGWVVNSLIVFELILVFILASECDNLILFIISKIIAFILLYKTNNVVLKNI